MARYYISDQHFFHKGLNHRMDNRGFSNVECMNQYMIYQWNSRIKRNDEVVILGDFSIGNAYETTEVLKQLKGKKYLITGNHDKFLADKNFDSSLFQWIRPYAEMNDNKRKVILCHYPIFCYNGQFRKNEEGVPKTWMLHGHTHYTQDQNLVEQFKEITRNYPRASKNSPDEPAPMQMINCFCMLSNYIPLTLDEWIEIENKQEILKYIQPDWKSDKNE